MSTENNKPNEMLSFLIMVFQWRFHTFFNGSQTQLMLAHVYEYCSKLNKQSRFVLFRNIARVSHSKLAYGQARHDFPVISILMRDKYESRTESTQEKKNRLNVELN